jgi:hypothetical protein
MQSKFFHDLLATKDASSEKEASASAAASTGDKVVGGNIDEYRVGWYSKPPLTRPPLLTGPSQILTAATRYKSCKNIK